MRKKKGKLFSSEEKTKIVLELIREDSPVSVLASKYEVSSKTIQNWKKQFIANASLAFEPAKVLSEYQEELGKLKEQNEELAKTLGKTIIERDWAVGKLKSLDLLNKKGLVDPKLKSLSQTRQCELLTINRSTIYYKKKPLGKDNLKILNRIDEIYTDNPEYGYRYIHRQLMEDGFIIGKDRVLKYMNVIGIEAIYPKKKKLAFIKDKEHKVYKYLLDKYWSKTDKIKKIDVPNVNEVWSSDITYIRTSGGFMYLAAIIDWHSRAILSYRLSNTMDTALVTAVLNEAIQKYGVPQILNSDQGSQYTSNKHTKILIDNNIAISMNGKGRSIDNIAIERFFRTLKYDCIFINDFKNVKELKEGISEYMNKYNYRRFHSSIGYQKPMDVYLNNLQSHKQIAA